MCVPFPFCVMIYTCLSTAIILDCFGGCILELTIANILCRTCPKQSSHERAHTANQVYTELRRIEINMRLLVGDIGGTNARLVMYEAPDDLSAYEDPPNCLTTHKAIVQKYYKNNDFTSFSEVLASFMSLPINAEKKVRSCCFAVAGPVSNNCINFTNRDGWIIDGHDIAQDFGFDRVELVNDFSASGYGLLSLTDDELVTLQEGKKTMLGTQPIALIGAGTGLGECYLTPNANGDLTAYATEGGHVEFAPRTPLEIELLSFIQNGLNSTSIDAKVGDMLPRVSVERVVSGKGLENVYEFLRHKYPEDVNRVYDDAYNDSKERGRLIGSEKYNYTLFRQAVEMMFAVYGGETGNLALKYLPFGGVYIAGGIAPKNIELINKRDSQFLTRFLDKGRMSSLMRDFPVHVVMKEDLGVRGAHFIAMRNAAEKLKRVEVNINQEQGDNHTWNSGLMDNPVVFASLVSGTTAVMTAATVVGMLYALRKWNMF